MRSDDAALFPHEQTQCRLLIFPSFRMRNLRRRPLLHKRNHIQSKGFAKGLEGFALGRALASSQY